MVQHLEVEKMGNHNKSMLNIFRWLTLLIINKSWPLCPIGPVQMWAPLTLCSCTSPEESRSAAKFWKLIEMRSAVLSRSKFIKFYYSFKFAAKTDFDPIGLLRFNGERNAIKIPSKSEPRSVFPRSRAQMCGRDLTKHFQRLLLETATQLSCFKCQSLINYLETGVQYFRNTFRCLFP